MDRILLKIRNDGEGCWLHTVSRKRRSFLRLYISNKLVEQIDSENRGTAIFDGENFAQITYIKDKVDIRFFWLFYTGSGTFEGYEETVRIPREIFTKALKNKGEYKCLSVKRKSHPRIEFRSKKNLSAAVANKTVRKKLSRFFVDHFAWPGSDKIIIYDDFVSYSFYFEEYKGDTCGICGGIILHGQDNLATAHYEIHT